MIKLCAQTLTPFRILGEEKSFTLWKKCGFDCIDYSMFQPIDGEWMNQPMESMLAYYRKLRIEAETCGLSFHQMHSPYVAAGKKAEEWDSTLLPYVLKAIEVCGTLGAQHLVVHANPLRGGLYTHNGDKEMERLIRYFSQMIQKAREQNVVLCIENTSALDANMSRCPTLTMFASSLNKLVDRLNELAGEKRFGVCLDIGHAGIDGACAADMVHGLAANLCCLHVHDNDGKTDQHLMPYIGKTDVEGVCRALHEIHYQGDLTFECDNTLTRFPKALLPDAVQLQAQVGRYLASIIEGEQV